MAFGLPKFSEMTEMLDTRFADLKRELDEIENVLRDILTELKGPRR